MTKGNPNGRLGRPTITRTCSPEFEIHFANGTGFDPFHETVRRSTKILNVPRVESRILHKLISSSGYVNKSDLAKELKVEESTVWSFMGRLKKMLGGGCIETRNGMGYRLRRKER